MSKFYNRIKNILLSLNEGLFERQEVMNVTFLSSIAGETIFMLGPPGVAKSLIARRLKFAFKDAKSFEYLMHRFSTPDEVFGPISIGKLRSEDKLERVVDYYLPGSNIAFLDEIWKAGPSIQNTLLTIINEKIYRNGEQELKVDLFGLVAASNELPEKNQGLEALWDRFIFRFYIEGIQDKINFEKMIVDIKVLHEDNIDEKLKISKEEYFTWQNQRDLVIVPSEILELINHIRVKVFKHNEEIIENENEEQSRIYISDRRWKKIIKVLRTSAFLNGRKKVDLMDCFLVVNMLWDNIEQISIIDNIVRECIRFQGYSLNLDLNEIKKAINDLAKEVDSETQNIAVTKIQVPKVHNRSFYKIDFEDEDISLIKASDFKKMKMNNEIEIDLCDEDGDPAAYMDAKKIDDISLEIGEETYNLILKTTDRKVLTTKQPHKLLVENWDSRIEKIKSSINEKIAQVHKYEKSDLKELSRNLFVDKSNANLIIEKIESLRVNIAQLEVNCDELLDKYHDIEDGKVIEIISKKTRRSKRG